MPKTKKIVLVGLSQIDKSVFYQKIVKKHALNKAYIPQINELINYTENLVEFQNNYYLFINPPNFIFRPRTEIEKVLQKQNTELIQKSDLILWVTNAGQQISHGLSIRSADRIVKARAQRALSALIRRRHMGGEGQRAQVQRGVGIQAFARQDADVVRFEIEEPSVRLA